MSDVQKAIQSIIQSFQTRDGSVPRHSTHPLVCISRDYGTGGDEIAQLLGRRLGVEVYDRQIIDRIAKRLDAEPETMRVIDANAGKLRDLWLYSMVTGQNLSADHYKHHLINVVVSLARQGGIIVGIGAHLILANSGALRVRITGSIEVCAQRLAEKQGIALESARREVETINQRRGKFIWDTFGVRVNDPQAFDLVINTDRLGEDAQIVEFLVTSLEMIQHSPSLHSHA